MSWKGNSNPSEESLNDGILASILLTGLKLEIVILRD